MINELAARQDVNNLISKFFSEEELSSDDSSLELGTKIKRQLERHMEEFGRLPDFTRPDKLTFAEKGIFISKCLFQDRFVSKFNIDIDSKIADDNSFIEITINEINGDSYLYSVSLLATDARDFTENNDIPFNKIIIVPDTMNMGLLKNNEFSDPSSSRYFYYIEELLGYNFTDDIQLVENFEEVEGIRNLSALNRDSLICESFKLESIPKNIVSNMLKKKSQTVEKFDFTI